MLLGSAKISRALAALNDPPLRHHHDLIRDRDRLRLRVGDMNGCDTQPLLHLLQFRPHLQTQKLVERRKRFVNNSTRGRG